MVGLFNLVISSFSIGFLFLFFSFTQLNSAIVGLASWYGEAFHGKVTANGEKFDMTSLTAAHKELPFNTVIKVTNLLNNRTVVVRINDRGPFRKDRIIDLSKAAAEKLDFLGIGVAPVKIEIVEKLDEKKVITQESKKTFNILDSFKDNSIVSDSELGIDTNLEKAHFDVAEKILDNSTQKPDFYIQIGSYKTKDYAQRAYKILKKVGLNVLVNAHGPFFTVFIPTYADDVHKNVELINSTGYKDILVRKTKIPGDNVSID
ncbi:septal ring lytic transglycosylase RlpA family protein [Borrelia miyamotoi]|uniref:Probable endolytic peptidoglycan transglycosylase RlpA n=1 Tax=Borrelia miyamotoi TaxID=47466 RepID=A0AAX3JL40_9SPIR|nr:septal ring lytic transglycosylase RlpA family protein [Borrelia miyamotoi]QFP41641.1 septal ring lytic transglycosylase RlpA family protein [Borrelia miyamotoi]QFP47761.1 septal ring lytic transglycosylase RlpA family protein [Borrelia miyamotoi]QGT55521.1 septal ring lytic transglycosylase RlpA family protein [Borrelia miyamotoi]QGT56303.1 septal ring lytic transglycosylase RlpA family protein [Borrelia miyamotoi]WAZ71551.1 septal ring lytic transglycosylase RlpA family protein [Borrelia 